MVGQLDGGMDGRNELTVGSTDGWQNGCRVGLG